MAQSNPEKISFDQLLQLVEQLPVAQQEQLRQTLNGKVWGDEWEQLSQKIQAKFQADGIPVPTEEEVMAEVKAVRARRKEERA